MLQKLYEKLASLNLGLWLMGLVMVALAAGSFSPGASETAGINDIPLFAWLKETPLGYSWWLWLAVALLVVLVVNTVLCTIEALRRRGRSIAPHLMHAGFLLIVVAHLFSAYGSLKAQVPLLEGRTLDFPDGSKVKVESIHAVSGSMGMMTSYSADLRTPRGELKEVRPNQPLFYGGYGVYLKEVEMEPAPAGLFEVHREPGAWPALLGALLFTIGNIMLLSVRRGRS